MIAGHGASSARAATDEKKCVAAQLEATWGAPWLNDREILIAKLSDTGAVAGVRVHPDGSRIPIILINEETLKNPIVRELAEKSLGFMMDISGGSSTDIDHGSFRIGDKRLVDYGGQGHREVRDSSGNLQYGSGELEKTGLLHRDFWGYIKARAETWRKKGTSRPYFELVFPESKDRIEATLYYHDMRRAGLVRSVMESTLRYESEPTQRYFRGLPHTLSDCAAENCVTYGTGTRLEAQIAEMKNRIETISKNWDVEAFLRAPEIRHFLARARDILLEVDWKDPNAMNQKMLDRPDLWQILNPILPEYLKTAQNHGLAYELLCMIVGQDAATKYHDITKALGANVFIGRDTDPWDHRPRAYSDKKPELDSMNPSAVAVFVWAEGPEAQKQVREGRYEYRGAKHGLYRTENSPGGNKQEPLPSRPEPPAAHPVGP